MKYFIILFFLLKLSPFALSQGFKEKTVWTFDLYFDFGKSDIRPEYLSRLDSLAVGMNRDTGFYTYIRAHTDAVGSDKSNSALSKKRYASIRSYLMTKNVSAYHLNTEGFGEKSPVADNESEEGRQRNRRVEVLVKRRIRAISVSGIVQDSAGNFVPKARVILRGKNFMDSTMTNERGAYSINVPENLKGKLEVIVKNYFIETRLVEVKNLDLEVPTFNLMKVTIGATIKIKDLFFYKNTPKLFENSLPELDNIYQFMIFNNAYKIEIQGHVDFPGAPVPINHPMHALSKARAESVFEYLVARGISPKRMTPKGYANWEMVYSNPKSEDENVANRRVIIKILQME